jgi:hypothetical protein
VDWAVKQWPAPARPAHHQEDKESLRPTREASKNATPDELTSRCT